MAKTIKGERLGIDEISEAIDMSKSDTREIFKDFIAYMHRIPVGDKIAIPGLGIFEKIVRKPRKARNPKTGETMMTKKKITFKFKLASTLRDL